MKDKITLVLTPTEVENLRRAVSFALANCSEVKDLFFGVPLEPIERAFDRLHTTLQNALDNLKSGF